jgi:hypothetical protein
VVVLVVVDQDFQVTTDEDMFTLFAKARLVERPPLFKRIVGPNDFQSSARRRNKGGHHLFLAVAKVQLNRAIARDAGRGFGSTPAPK